MTEVRHRYNADADTYDLTNTLSQRDGPQWRPFNRRIEINTEWMRARWETRGCRHEWRTAHPETGAKACRHCGVFRWFPFIALMSCI